MATEEEKYATEVEVEDEGDVDGEGDYEEEKSTLTQEIIRQHLGQVDKTKDRKCAAFVRLNLQKQGIETLDGDLALFKELRYMNVQQNKLIDLEPMNELPNLVMVDARNNQIEKFDTFGSDHSTLSTILLDGNPIETFEDFNMPSIKNISLQGCQISNLETLEMATTPAFEMVNLTSNKLSTLEGLERMPHLKQLACSSNRVLSLEGVEGCNQLVSLDVSNNLLKEFADIERLVKHTHLRSLNVLGNAELVDLYDSPNMLLNEVILILPGLTTFNNAAITEEDRVRANNLKKARIAKKEEEAVKELAAAEAAAIIMQRGMNLDLEGIAIEGDGEYGAAPLTGMANTNITEDDAA